jgi:hypothetical protein
MPSLTSITSLTPPASHLGSLLAELLEATDRGMEIEAYLGLHSDGIPHAHILEVATRGIRTADYRRSRYAGASHLECMTFAISPGSLSLYADYRARGYPHTELFEVQAAGLDMVDYDGARAAGATHHQIMSLVEASRSNQLIDVAQWPTRGRHSDRREAAQIRLSKYTEARRAGHSHIRAQTAVIKHPRQAQWARSSWGTGNWRERSWRQGIE